MVAGCREIQRLQLGHNKDISIGITSCFSFSITMQAPPAGRESDVQCPYYVGIPGKHPHTSMPRVRKLHPNVHLNKDSISGFITYILLCSSTEHHGVDSGQHWGNPPCESIQVDEGRRN